MPIQPHALRGHDFAPTTQRYDARDAIIYALGVGLGQDTCNPDDLAFLDERQLSVLPSYAVTLTSPGMWIRDAAFGVDFAKLVHFEQMAWFSNPLPASADVVGDARILSLTDRGEGKGAVLVLERTISDAVSRTLYCRLHQTLLLRGDGGFGGDPTPLQPSIIPAVDAKLTARMRVSPRAALLYRLSGDWNPLHLDPLMAKQAGFERPILHGLASYAMAGVAVSRACDRDPGSIGALGCRFSGFIYPGDTLDVRVWSTGDTSAVFQAFVGDRKVLDQGQIIWK